MSAVKAVAEAIAVGRILRAHGLRGEVLVEVETDVTDRFAPGSRLWLEGRSGSVCVSSARKHQGRYLILFEGITDRSAAAELRGLELRVPRSSVPEPPEGAYYHFQLVGCTVSDRTLGDLGAVTDVIEDGGGLLLMTERSAGARLLIPFVAAYLESVDVSAGRIEVALPAGLVEICEST